MSEELTRDDQCDLNPDKTCDNCCQCIEPQNDYLEIPVRFEASGATHELPRSRPRTRRER